MVDNEYPYLEKPELLEYPTETWAAQDMRKSEVLYRASYFADGSNRNLFRDRAKYFYTISLEQLEHLPTSRFCRPQILLLVLGIVPIYCMANPATTMPEPTATGDLGPPIHFVAQKQRVIKTVKRAALAICFVMLLSVALSLTLAFK